MAKVFLLHFPFQFLLGSPYDDREAVQTPPLYGSNPTLEAKPWDRRCIPSPPPPAEAADGGNVDRVLFKNLVEMVPLVESLVVGAEWGKDLIFTLLSPSFSHSWWRKVRSPWLSSCVSRCRIGGRARLSRGGLLWSTRPHRPTRRRWGRSVIFKGWTLKSSFMFLWCSNLFLFFKFPSVFLLVDSVGKKKLYLHCLW